MANNIKQQISENNSKKLKKLIRETIENFHSYETVLDSYNSIYGFENVFKKINKSSINYESKFSIIWTLEIESRTWGLKSIYPVVTSVRGTIDWFVDKDELNNEEIEYLRNFSGYENKDQIEGKFELSSLNKFNGKEWKINHTDFKVSESGELYPTEIEIDFNEMLITIS